jgi:copper chaperone NosL
VTRRAPTCLVLLALLLPIGCDDQKEAPPAPAAIGDDAVGYYCGMLLSEHPGPKGQIRLASREEPVWFSSARDAIAFTRIPLEPRDIRAVYVSDMARAPTWDEPGADNWIAADAAWFVIGSSRQGGMGSAEAVPFGSEEGARAFASREGGRVVRLADIPDDFILGTGSGPARPAHEGHGG